jgi:hypothetical protein
VLRIPFDYDHNAMILVFDIPVGRGRRLYYPIARSAFCNFNQVKLQKSAKKIQKRA